MAVTDLTDSLPWWTRNGAGATGAPAGTPQGAGGLPGSGDSASWLQYLSQMFGISPAQAATMMQQQNGQQQQVPPNPHGDGPPGPVSPIAGQPAMNNFSNPPPANGPGPGNVGPVPLNASIAQPGGPSIMPGPMTGPAGPVSNLPRPIAAAPAPPASALRPPGISQPAGVSASGLPLQPGALSPGALAQFAPAAGGPIGSGGNVPWPSGGGGAPVPGPLATGGATGQGATSNPRFIGIDAPNASPQNSMRGGPQATALNLAGLFGGGAPAGAAPAAAAPVPGPMARPDLAQRVPLGNAPMPPTMPDDIAAARRQRAIQLAAARSGFA
jgi:hypothetical protein